MVFKNLFWDILHGCLAHIVSYAIIIYSIRELFKNEKNGFENDLITLLGIPQQLNIFVPFHDILVIVWLY